jgi:uncharacterized repeat protein (TIGR03943 family)
MRRDTQAVLLLLVGATLLKVGFAGTYVRYVKPTQLPLVLAAGFVLVAVAGVTIWRQVRAVMPATGSHRASAHRPHHHDDSYDVDDALGDDAPSAVSETDLEPGHGRGQSRIGWLLLAPALALLMFSPPALGAFQASRNGTAVTAPGGDGFPPLPAGDPIRLSLVDYASRAVFDTGHSLAGRQVTLSGFVIAGPKGQPYLARLVVSCCAADARPVKIGLAGDLPADLKPDEWIEVVGAYTQQQDRDPVNSEVIPYIQVGALKDIPTPTEQYET